MAAEPLASIRIDKWLWAARFFKTRSLAQEAVELGRVRLAGQRLKPSRDVKPGDRLTVEPGDRLTVERGEERFEIFVEKISAVRGPAPVAQTLYRETDESREKRERASEMRKIAMEPASTIAKGRPTKRDARLIRRVQSGWA